MVSLTELLAQKKAPPYTEQDVVEVATAWVTQKERCNIDDTIAGIGEIYDAEIINGFIQKELLGDIKCQTKK